MNKLILIILNILNQCIKRFASLLIIKKKVSRCSVVTHYIYNKHNLSQKLEIKSCISELVQKRISHKRLDSITQ